MKLRNLIRSLPRRAGMTAAVSLLACNLAAAGEADRGVLVLTSTNDPSSNQILVYQLDTAAPALSLVQTLPTGGQGGAGGNAGILQMEDDFGAVANFGSNSVSELLREGDYVQVRGQVRLVSGCSKPDWWRSPATGCSWSAPIAWRAMRGRQVIRKARSSTSPMRRRLKSWWARHGEP